MKVTTLPVGIVPLGTDLVKAMIVAATVAGSFGSVLRTTMFLPLKSISSRYVPRLTTTLSPFCAASIAPWMLAY